MSNSQNQTYDAELVLKDAGLVAASGAATVDGSAKILDVGAATVGWNAPMGPSNRIGPSFSANVQIDISAIEIASDDEIYDIIIQGSSDADFGTPGNIVELAQRSFSAKEVKRSDCDRDDTAGRYIMPFHNVFDGVAYRYIRIYTVVAGSVATGINYTARCGVLTQT